jgi:long-chain fatty acid transport protein
MGTALAGCSARSDDASFFFCNPATISGLDGPNLTLDARLFAPSVRIDSNAASSPLGTNITAAGGSGEMASPVIVPSGFAAIPIAQSLWLGLGVTGPFGLKLDAQPAWAGRFQLSDVDMKGFNLSSALAWRVTPWLTLAGGIQAQQFSAEFEQSRIIPTPFGPLEARGFLTGKDWAFGAIAGLLLTPTESTRIGVGYRSALSLRMRGDAGVEFPGVPVDSASFDVNLPDVVSLGIEQRLNPAVRLFAEANWVNWSRFKGLDIAFGSGRPHELRPQSWRDTWMVAGGLGYMLRPGTELTAGVHYDTAVSAGGGNTLSPDGARIALAIGLSQKISDMVAISAHYAHIFIDDVQIAAASPTSGTFNGVYKASLNTVGLTMRFKL